MRPNILVLADVPGWAWCQKARAYEQWLSDEFDITVAYQQGEPHVPENLDQFDLLHLFEVSQLGHVPLPYRGQIVAGLTALVWQTWGEARMAAWAARCSALHGNSPQIVSELLAFHSRIYYCPNGVDAELFHRSVVRTGDVAACHVGKPNPRKGGALLVEACRRVG